MKNIQAFLRIIRWQNLLFIVITQLLFHYCILQPNLLEISQSPQIKNINLWFIIISSVLIAAGGNIINDYFDLNIDKINKPEKIIVDKYISRRWVIFLHLFISLTGIMFSVYVAQKLNLFWISIANTFCVLMLFIYSASLKKKFLIGNIAVSVLTAWVIFILVIPEYQIPTIYNQKTIEVYDKIFRLGILYASFSFIISVVREVVKDMEDMEGDRKNGCQTMPIVLGLNATKTFVAVWLIVLIGLLIIAQVYVVRFGWWASIIYSIVLLIIPLLFIIKKVFKAQHSIEFHKLSSYIKWVMLMGILSMIFFRIYR